MQNSFDQVVIYGAKGWLGRSAIDAFLSSNGDPKQLLLVGSKSENGNDANVPCSIYSATDASELVATNALFINAAYLRREKSYEIAPEAYLSRISEIREFPIEILKKRQVKSFINLSSGAAKEAEEIVTRTSIDIYSASKFETELLLRRETERACTPLQNCRIFNVSGKYLNEFEYLALGTFIHQAEQNEKTIVVNSPQSLRTYIDSQDLMSVLIQLSMLKESCDLDSGGFLISMQELANEIARQLVGVQVKTKKLPDLASTYHGDFQRFNDIAKLQGVELKSISEQIEETLRAVRLAKFSFPKGKQQQVE